MERTDTEPQTFQQPEAPYPNITELPGLTQIPTQRTYKDSLFRMIYSGKDARSRRWLLSLYNALSGKNHTDINELQITTIENVIYISMKNDLSFLIDSQMNLIEQQSTINPNMPLRGLMYFSQLYQSDINRRKKNVYGRALVKIPSPRFIVFYNGNEKLPEIIKYKLSDAFEIPDKSGEFEWTATVININIDYNKSLQKKCLSLYHYIAFVDRVKNNLEKKMTTSEAINEAVDYAIQNNFLEGFFKEQKMLVLNNLLTEFDEEYFAQSCKEAGYEEGVADGEVIGARQNAIANAKNLLTNTDLLPKTIAQCCDLPLEQVLELKAEIENRNK